MEESPLMEQNRSCREEEVPNRASRMEKAEGSREPFEHPDNRRNSGGITNRPLDREQCEQQQLPDRGHSQSDRPDQSDQAEG